jgi:hypothetical protein
MSSIATPIQATALAVVTDGPAASEHLGGPASGRGVTARAEARTQP